MTKFWMVVVTVLTLGISTTSCVNDEGANICQRTVDHCTSCGVDSHRDGCSDALYCVEHPDDPAATPGVLDWIQCVGEVPCAAFEDGTAGDYVSTCCAETSTGCSGV